MGDRERAAPLSLREWEEDDRERLEPMREALRRAERIRLCLELEGAFREDPKIRALNIEWDDEAGLFDCWELAGQAWGERSCEAQSALERFFGREALEGLEGSPLAEIPPEGLEIRRGSAEEIARALGMAEAAAELEASRLRAAAGKASGIGKRGRGM